VESGTRKEEALIFGNASVLVRLALLCRVVSAHQVGHHRPIHSGNAGQLVVAPCDLV
jgi:hypothetical protein